MQTEITLEHRKTGDVWTYRWRGADAYGNVVRHRLVLGTVEEFSTPESAMEAFSGLIRAVNSGDVRVQTTLMTVKQLVAHYEQRELPRRDSVSSEHVTGVGEKRYSTIETCEGYLHNWILPRWGDYALSDVKTVEIEEWLKSGLTNRRNSHLKLAPDTRKKLHAVMKTLFYHAERYDLYHGKNPVVRARVCGGRRRIPEILTFEDIGILAEALEFREYVMVATDETTGLRESELFGLQWQDIDFANLRIKINRSIVKQRVGLCKTDRSHGTAPLDPEIAELLREWRAQAKYSGESDWVFASSHSQGKKPYWGAQIMRTKIKPIAQKLGIPRLEGWHTFRHTYSSMLTENGANLKVVQELMRHRTIRTTMDTYTHATTPSKRQAQTGLVKKLQLPKRRN